jgi:hypothetical protein
LGGSAGPLPILTILIPSLIITYHEYRIAQLS